MGGSNRVKLSKTLLTKGERESFFLSMTHPCPERAHCGRETYAPNFGEPKLTCELDEEKSTSFRVWCECLLDSLEKKETRSVSEVTRAASLNALRRFEKRGILLSCILQGVYDFVGYDMLTNQQAEDSKTYLEAQKLSSDRLKTIEGKFAYFSREEINNSTGPPCAELLEDKVALIEMITLALRALSDIHNYERDQLAVGSRKDEFAKLQAVHIRLLLPPVIYFNGNKWWKDVAAIMSQAKHIFTTVESRKGQTRTYTAEALSKLADEFTPQDGKRLRNSFKAVLPDVFARLEHQSVEQVLIAARNARVYRPTGASSEMMRLSMAYKQGIILFGCSEVPTSTGAIVQ